MICFEETNVVGNGYFARHVAWQGACREMVLRAHAPPVPDEIERDLRLGTISVDCDHFQALRDFDEVALRMTLAHLRGNRIGLAFDDRVLRDGGALQCALGRQEIGCMRARPDARALDPCPSPPDLREALAAFGGG